MSEEYEENSYEMPDHPALKNFSPATEKVKHVIGKTLKWGAIGALVGAAVLAAATAVFTATALLSLPFGIGGILGLLGLGSGMATGALGSVAAIGATVGVALGGGLGLITSISGANGAADDKAEELIAAHERGEMRQEKMAALAHRRELQRLALIRQERAMGINPNTALPGREMDGRGLA